MKSDRRPAGSEYQGRREYDKIKNAAPPFSPLFRATACTQLRRFLADQGSAADIMCKQCTTNFAKCDQQLCFGCISKQAATVTAKRSHEDTLLYPLLDTSGGSPSAASKDTPASSNKYGTSEYRGVSRSKHKFNARIKHMGKTVCVGEFDTELEAAYAVRGHAGLAHNAMPTHRRTPPPAAAPYVVSRCSIVLF